MAKSKANLTELATSYRASRRAGCRKNGTLTIGGKAYQGWNFVERQADGDLIVAETDNDRQLWKITLSPWLPFYKLK